MIEVANLTKYYDNVCALNNISFNINENEITGLLGPNGAGKTTAMRIITGFLKKTNGKVLVNNLDVENDPVIVKRLIGYLPESAPLYSDMMVYDYLKYTAALYNIKKKSRINDTAGLCGLTDVMHKNIGELSKGYKRRVGLAHAMINDPRILILDEPTDGLDPNQIIGIRNLIKEIGKTKTVILSTHILSEVEASCERVIIINKGNIAADNKTVELQRSYNSKANITVCLTGCVFDELKEASSGIRGVTNVENVRLEPDATCAVISTNEEIDIRGEIFKMVRDKGWILLEMRKEHNTLEKIFRDLTIGGKNE